MQQQNKHISALLQSLEMINNVGTNNGDQLASEGEEFEIEIM
jgi:hypothetical protein